MNYSHKYEKYKKKYLELKKQHGGANKEDIMNQDDDLEINDGNILDDDLDNMNDNQISDDNIDNDESQEITLKNWQIAKSNSIKDIFSFDKKIELKSKNSILNFCYELKFGPFDTSKKIGNFNENELVVTNVDNESMKITDLRDNKIYILLKENACHNSIHSDIDFKFREEKIPDEFQDSYFKFSGKNRISEVLFGGDNIQQVSNVKSSESQNETKVIELNNWTINENDNYIDKIKDNRLFLKKKANIFDTCYELRLGPLNTSKIIGEFGNELEVKKVDKHYIEVYDSKNNFIYKLYKKKACTDLIQSLNYIDDDVDGHFRNNFILKSDISVENYDKFWKSKIFSII